MSKAGEFEIDVWQGGWPIWCVISRQGERLTQVDARHLPDLAYAVERARIEAREIAKDINPTAAVDAF